MSKLKKERLNQMIENALSYKQESKKFNSDFLQKRLKGFSLKPKVYGLTFASLIITCIFIPQIFTSRNLFLLLVELMSKFPFFYPPIKDKICQNK